jgi:hypothetical protein
MDMQVPTTAAIGGWRMRVARYFLGGFEGQPGNYHLEMGVLSDTGCFGCRQATRVHNSQLRCLRGMEPL